MTAKIGTPEFFVETWLFMYHGFRIDQTPPDRMPLAHSILGGDSMIVAIGYLLLGEMEKARAWFCRSAEHWAQALRIQEDTVVPEMRALECAMLSGDPELRVRVAEAIPSRDSRRKPQEYPYTMFLKHTILGDRVEATAFAREAASQHPQTMKKRGSYAAVGEACVALDDGDSEALAKALKGLLAEHKLKASHGLRNRPEGRICLPATTLVLLALDLGLAISVESPYVPIQLLNSPKG